MSESLRDQIMNEAEFCSNCDQIKYIYYMLIEPNINKGFYFYTESNRKSKEKLVCSKHTTKSD